jgi:hypothetical protein
MKIKTYKDAICAVEGVAPNGFQETDIATIAHPSEGVGIYVSNSFLTPSQARRVANHILKMADRLEAAK